MEYRRIGQTDLEASVLGFGCNRIAERDRREALATMERAIGAGITYFDTADRYGNGASERLLGEVLKGRRDRVIVCSKAGKKYGPLVRIKDRLRPVIKHLRGRSATAAGAVEAAKKSSLVASFDPAYIARSVERSLSRLATDYLDLFLLHNPPAGAAFDDALFAALDRLKERGLIRYIGVSCGPELWGNPEALAALLARPALAALQMRVNLQQPGPIERVLPLTRTAEVSVIAYEPLGKGTLSTDPRLQEALAKLPERTPAQAALQFVLQQPGIAVVLVGATQRRHLDENLAALTRPHLTDQEIERLLQVAR